MAKFKTGDKVRRIKMEYRGVAKGQVVTVAQVQPFGTWFSIVEKPSNEFDPFPYSQDSFELVTEQSELESLVATANAGWVALTKIIKNHSGRVERVFPSGSAEDLPRTLPFEVESFRIKQKPPFEPFTVGQGWRVELDGGMLRIGCQSFVPDVLRSYLIDLCDRNVLSAGNLSATRTGVAMEGTPHSISWADADKLLSALKKVGA